MCCRMEVTRENGRPFPRRVLGKRLLQRYETLHQALPTMPTSMMVFDATRRGRHPSGHAVGQLQVMRMLKEAIGFASLCHQKDVVCSVEQVSGPCDNHLSQYPFLLSDFCMEATKVKEIQGGMVP